MPVGQGQVSPPLMAETEAVGIDARLSQIGRRRLRLIVQLPFQEPVQKVQGMEQRTGGGEPPTGRQLVEPTGIEPATFSLRTRRSTN